MPRCACSTTRTLPAAGSPAKRRDLEGNGMNCATLISVSELASHLEDPQLVIFDCRHDLMKPGAGELAYAQGHIPGAHFADTDRDLSGPKNGRNGRHPLPDAQ